MARSFFLGTDAELYTGSCAFSNQISATPTAFGLSGPIAASYAVVHDLYAAAYLEASNPETRTRGKVEAKNRAKASLKAAAAGVAKIISGTVGVTNEQKINLGLNVRATPSRVPPPALEPAMEIVSVNGFNVRVRLRDKGGAARRGRPVGVVGASIFTHVGTTPPSELSAWTFHANVGRTTFDLALPGTTAAGAKVYVCAFWFNYRKQRGPVCPAVGFNLPGGGVAMAA